MTLVTGNNSIDSLVHSSWKNNPNTPVSLTYSFLTSAPADASSDDRNGFLPMNVAQKAAVRDALAKWAAVANITFTEVASGGNLEMGTNDQSSADSAAYAYLPEQGVRSVAMYTSNKYATNFSFGVGSYGVTVLVHEIGHMLGLKHPGFYNSSGDSPEGPYLPSAQDNTDYTVMSYNAGKETNINGKYPGAPMLYDIQAMQFLYGANMSYHAGTDVYSFTSANVPTCIWDAGGSNTFDFSACTSRVTINLAAGSFSETQPGLNNVSIAYGVSIQTAIAGSGGSIIHANDLGDVITGGNGTDTIYEGGGSDTINAGLGNDTVVFSKAFASYVVQRDANGVTVKGDGTDTLTGVEFLQFNDQLVNVSTLPLAGQTVMGTTANDILIAHGGNESFDGGAGIDTLIAGASRANFQIAANSTGFTLDDVLGSGGDDQLVNVERISFTDGAVALDINGDGGQAYRLYQATFNRAPDKAGLGFWISFMDKGMSLSSVAQFFIDSPEFKQLYGSNPTDTQFITALYHNALHREPEASGLAWYLDQMSNHGFTRAQALVGFSESPENQAQVIGSIQNGMDYIPYTG